MAGVAGHLSDHFRSNSTQCMVDLTQSWLGQVFVTLTTSEEHLLLSKRTHSWLDQVFVTLTTLEASNLLDVRLASPGKRQCATQFLLENKFYQSLTS